ncbi:MAG UNVERIFIED_CONTAM: hypothetical protein LVR18_48725 [Planctomycetaceae bacterium]|jgi:hypothetical protein
MGKENPYRRALQVLQSVAWVEGLPAPFDAGSIQFSPVAEEAWRACVDVVAGLIDFAAIDEVAETGSGCCPSKPFPPGSAKQVSKLLRTFRLKVELMRRETLYDEPALAVDALMALLDIVSARHLVDPNGRLRAAEQKRQERLAVVRGFCCR